MSSPTFLHFDSQRILRITKRTRSEVSVDILLDHVVKTLIVGQLAIEARLNDGEIMVSFRVVRSGSSQSSYSTR